MNMKKSEALKIANGSVNELARMLGISHSAVSRWSAEKIPKRREYEVREIINNRKSQPTN